MERVEVKMLSVSIKSPIPAVLNNWEICWPTQEEGKSLGQHLAEILRDLVPFHPSILPHIASL